jgi:site-specific DNA recombinase
MGQDLGSEHDLDDMATLTVPAILKRMGREMRMLVGNAGDQTAADPSLLRIVARAHDIQGALAKIQSYPCTTSPVQNE